MFEFKKYIKYSFEKIKLYLNNFKITDKKVIIAFFVGILFFIIYIYLHSPPKDFPVGKVFSVSTGESL